jgi:tetratricopeptide (TPR) repeat protein
LRLGSDPPMTADSETVRDLPSPDEIRRAVDRVVVSEVFSRSPQLAAFLRFVVEAVLHNRQDRIKAYTIGVEVLRRDPKFDPQIDPIVRVEATRLRRAIERYYAGPGANDPLLIDLPRGSYVPTFRYREPDVAAVPPIAGLTTVTRMRPKTIAVCVAGALAAIVAAVVAVQLGGLRVPFGGGALPPGNGMPTVMIETPRVLGAPPAGVPADLLHVKINDAFARFDTINVVQVVSEGRLPVRAPRADYHLASVIEYWTAASNIWFRLVDGTDGTVVWSSNFEGVAALSAAEADEIVITVANSLLQAYGVIRSRDRARYLGSAGGDPRYRCVLEATLSISTADRADHDRARDCLERLTSIDPGFAVGFTFLALIYSREYYLGLEPRPGDAPVLDRSLRAARQAAALHPESSRAYLALLVVLFNRRDFPGAFAAAEKSIALNRYDMLALGEYGGRLIFIGEVERGLTMMRRADSVGAVRASWQLIYLFVGNYLTGNAPAAARFASQIPSDNFALGQVARALAAASSGDAAGARQAIDRLVQMKPSWRADPRAELARAIPDSGIVDRLLADLYAAGLEKAS